MCRESFEFDYIIGITLGVVIGVGIYRLMKIIFGRKQGKTDEEHNMRHFGLNNPHCSPECLCMLYKSQKPSCLSASVQALHNNQMKRRKSHSAIFKRKATQITSYSYSMSRLKVTIRQEHLVMVVRGKTKEGGTLRF